MSNQLHPTDSKELAENALPVARSAPNELYNLSKLSHIANGDQEFIDEMTQLFIEQSQLSIVELRVAYEENSVERVQKIAHRIKTSIDMMDIHALKEEIRLLEYAEEAGLTYETIRIKIGLVSEVLEQVMNHLKTIQPS